MKRLLLLVSLIAAISNVSAGTKIYLKTITNNTNEEVLIPEAENVKKALRIAPKTTAAVELLLGEASYTLGEEGIEEETFELNFNQAGKENSIIASSHKPIPTLEEIMAGRESGKDYNQLDILIDEEGEAQPYLISREGYHKGKEQSLMFDITLEDNLADSKVTDFYGVTR